MINLLLLFLLNVEIFETEETRDFEIIVKEFESLKISPLDINTAAQEDLMKIPYLTITDCLKIIGYRQKYGPFSSVEDLSNIPGLDQITVNRIKPYMTIKAKPFKLENLTTRIRFKKTLKETKSEEYYTRSQAVFNEYNIFLITEKDPYESSFFDYYASGLLIDEGKRRFAFGKYDLDLGSGVILSSVGSFFQSTDFRMITSERGIIPYTSTIENSGFFGAALSDSLFLNYTLFYSNQKLDGRIDSLGYARSFDETGKHIDSLSINRKDCINEELWGYDIKYHLPNILIANRAYLCNYNPPFVCEDSFSQFYGKNFWITGLGAKYFGDYFVLFTEVARAYKNRLGGLFGFSGLFPYNLDFNIAGKYFPLGFYSPKGIEADNDFLGLTIDVNHNSKLANLGANLNINNQTEEDSSRYDLRLNFEKGLGILNSKFQMRWRYVENTMELSGSKIFLRLAPIKIVYFDLRLEEKYIYDDTLQKGIFAGFELGIDFKKFESKIRYGVFNTDSYASRIFVYEPDLPGVINNRMLYEKGQYGLIYLGLKPINKVILSFKFSAIEKDSLTQQIGAQFDLKL